MNLTASVTSLTAAMATTIAAVERRSTIPILSNVLLVATDGTLTVTASDLDIDVTTSIDADVSAEGDVTINAAVLLAALKKFSKAGDVSIVAANGSAEIKSGRSRMQVQTLPADDFPKMTRPENGTVISIKASDLAALLGTCAFAMSNDELRYYLNGVFLHNDDGVISAVATDLHKLAYRKGIVPAGDMPNIILPFKSVNYINGLVSGGDFDVEMIVTRTKAMFSFGDTVFITKIVDGTYPDYKRGIPTDNTIAVRADASELARIMDTVQIVSDDKSKACDLHIDATSITASMRGQNNQQADDAIDIAGDVEYDMRFNVKYMLDTLARIDGDAVFNLSEAGGTPIIVRDSADDNVLFVVMPMRG